MAFKEFAVSFFNFHLGEFIGGLSPHMTFVVHCLLDLQQIHLYYGRTLGLNPSAFLLAVSPSDYIRGACSATTRFIFQEHTVCSLAVSFEKTFEAHCCQSNYHWS